MKRITIILSMIVFFSTIYAQTTNDEIEYIQAMFGMEKRAAVKEFITLENTEAVVFWKLYDEYEVKRKTYGKERIVLLEKFAEQFDTMTDQESIEWMKSVIALRNKNEKIITAYYKKVLKECSPTVAMKFFQIESYILAGTRFQILENVPF